ncbi:MAG: ATP-binding cassette domain-containing protein [Pseudomonadota bacterium]
MINITEVTHHIAGNTVLSDINLQVPEGQVVALIGPNGAGKSTLLSLIARLTAIQQGSIAVDTLDVSKSPSTTLAQHLSILPQTSEINLRITVSELVSFGRYPYHKGRPTSKDDDFIENAIMAFELQPLAHRTLTTLSGGERQRALLAMTYAQNTHYILLDEPLNNLDIAASRSLMKTLRSLTREHGRTVVIVLHDINYACAYADHIVTMKNGQLGPCGSPADIISTALLEDIFGTDAKVLSGPDYPLVLV